MAAKFTFKQFQARFPDDDACLTEIYRRRYENFDACPNCGLVGKMTKITGRRAFACPAGCHVYPCAGTEFEHSSTSLSQWFHAMYLFTATRNGVSAKELQRQLGVTYKCAWRIGHQLRDLMGAQDQTTNSGPMGGKGGHVEMDEVYIGGRIRKFKQYGKGDYLKNKTTVFGMLE